MPEMEIIYDPNLPVAFVGGEVIPTGRKPITASEIMDGLRNALSKEYQGLDPKRMGLTRSEAMLEALADKAADGDLDATSKILDRTMGKPIQQVQSLTVSSTWKEFLDELKADRARRSGIDSSPF